MSGEILLVEDYKVYYKTLSGMVKAVDGVSLRVDSKTIVGIIGESGSGKSTFVQSIILPKYPMVYIGGKALFLGEYNLPELTPKEKRNLLLTKLAYIPQYALDSLPAIKKIKMFLKDIASEKKVEYDELVAKFKERLRQVNLPEKVLDMYPLQLSGGMKQRVLIAISTLFKPSLLIADEPTSALDVVTQRQVVELLRDLRDEGTVDSLMIITHDITLVRQIADRIVTMYAGKLVEEGEVEEIIREPLHPYTSLLVKSIPPIGLNYKQNKLRGLGGAPPSLLNPPKGCRFHPRCPHAMDKCRVEEPPIIQIGRSRVSCWLYVKG